MISLLKERPLLLKAVVGTVVLAVLAGLALLVVAPWKQLPDGIALTAAGQEITVRDLQRRTDVLEALYGLREPADAAAADQFRRAAAQTVATSIVIDAVAAERGISVPDEQVQQQLDQLVAAREKSDGAGGFTRLLAKIGASEQDVRDELRRRSTHEQLFDEIRAGVPKATEDEVRASYDQRAAELVVPEQRRISNIVTASREEAQGVVEKARAGADFPTLARQASLDRATRENGGDLGAVARAQLEAGYGDAAFGAALTVPFGPVQTEHGWNVGEVTQIVPGRRLGWEEARERVAADLERTRVLQAWEGWLDEQVAQRDLVYADAYRPADPTAALPPAGQPGAPR